MLSNKNWRLLPILAIGLLIMAACSAPTPAATTAPTEAPQVTAAPTEAMTEAPTEAANPMDKLAADAKAEGSLNVIALDPTWCGYRALIDNFKTKYGLTVNELNPGGSSGQEVDAIKANESNPGPQAPDVIDVGFAFGPSSKTDGILQPYKVSTWDTIPDSAKDADGFWYGDYYGVLAFLVNTDVQSKVPTDWKDLLDPAYKGQVALTGVPTQSNQAINSVYAAALANGGSLDDAKPGLDFFAKLNAAGNFVPVVSTNALVAKGETPVRITWDYLALAAIDSYAGNPKAVVVVPKTGVLGGVYVQGISKFAPHPNAAKLWMEYLYSDEGQLGYLAAYCHPIRYNDLAKNSKIPADLAAKLPSAELYASAAFPTLDQLTKAKDTITGADGWDKVVGVSVPTPSP